MCVVQKLCVWTISLIEYRQDSAHFRTPDCRQFSARQCSPQSPSRDLQKTLAFIRFPIPVVEPLRSASEVLLLRPPSVGQPFSFVLEKRACTNNTRVYQSAGCGGNAPPVRVECNEQELCARTQPRANGKIGGNWRLDITSVLTQRPYE